MKGNPFVEAKQERIIALLKLIQKKREVDMRDLLTVAFDFMHIDPDLTRKYLRKLEDLGKIRISDTGDKVIASLPIRTDIAQEVQDDEKM